MGSGYSKMKKQAKMMQEQMSKMQDELKSKTFEGTSGNGLVKLSISGEKRLKDIQIDPSCIDPSDVEGLEDLIVAAFNDAFEKASEQDESNVGLNNLLEF